MAALNDMFERGRTVYQKSSRTYFRSGVFTMLLGAVFMLLGVFAIASGTRSELNIFLFVMGLIFAGWGISFLVSAKKMGQK